MPACSWRGADVSTLLVETRGRDLRTAFGSVPNAVLTLSAVIVAAVALVPFARWALIDARWRGTAMDCRAPGVGACWAFIGHKLPFVLFGLYPATERWRPALATTVIACLVVASMLPRLWRKELIAAWIIGL